MRRTTLALMIAAIAAVPTAGALSFLDITAALTLGVAPSGHLVDLALHEQHDTISEGERQLLHGELQDPTALLELPRIPPELLGMMTIDSIGPVLGPRVSALPSDTLLNTVAISQGPVPASALDSTTTNASIRNEDPAAQNADLQGMFGDG